MNRKERRQREKLRRTRGASTLPEGLQEAVSLHQGGRIGDALPLYQRFLSEQPNHPDALNDCGLAITLLQQQRIEEGLGIIGSLLKDTWLTANQRYALFVNRAIYAWLQEDLGELGNCLQGCRTHADAIDQTTIDASPCIDQLYLERLLRYREENTDLYEAPANGSLHLIEESHSLSPNGTSVAVKGISSNFNEALKNAAAERGASFLDAYGQTVNADGTADGERHIDHYHLLPNFLSEALAE